jgi:anaerobic selenocysteine-containing dehydrogenase/Fe-S-cluster-containing dehydrogenase component
MSEPFQFNRRDFLKLVGIGLAGTAAGCAEAPSNQLIPYLVAPQDIIPGVPYWYASTCRECPAGCGTLVKTREGRAIKIEGNPDHPVNRGGLCARGQAGLQGLYDADRLKGPMVRDGGSWKPTSWDNALKAAAQGLQQARTAGRRIALVSEHAPGSFESLAVQWAKAAGGTYSAFEAFHPHAQREANRRTFGVAVIPDHDIARAHFLISFGADFLETWGSPVSQARGFAAMRARPEGMFVTVEPRLSMTGANADEWVAIRPGTEMVLALGMAQVILSEGLAPAGAGLGDLVAAFTPAEVEKRTDVPAATVTRLARAFAAAKPGLALAGGIANQSEQAVAMHAAVNLLNHVTGNVGQTVRFDRTLNDEAVASFKEFQGLADAMDRGDVAALVIHEANPAYATPSWSGFASAAAKVPFKLSLSNVMDETTALCDVVLPSSHVLESLGDSFAVRGVYSLIQPTMQRLPMFDTRSAGDTLIALAAAAGFGLGLPASWKAHVESTWRPLHARLGAGRSWEEFWNEALRTGGVWEDVEPLPTRWGSAPEFAAPELRGGGDYALVLTASPAHYDGRGANKPWLQELPDPTTKVVWGSWVELHPDTAGKLGVENGDVVRVETEAGSVEAPVYVYPGIRKDAVAIPLGQGHTAYGRHARDIGVNALALLSPAQDAASGSVAYLSSKARLSKSAGRNALALTQRQKSQGDRAVAQIIPLSALMSSPGAGGEGGVPAPHPGATAPEHHPPPDPSQTRPGKYTEPRATPPGYVPPAHSISPSEPEVVVRGPRRIPVDQDSYDAKHAKHRWAMAVDLNACTGCSACIVACSAENNVPFVGPQLVQRGREMMWIRIERYEEKLAPGKIDVRNLPMMCQQCSDAPCETVCPVYATYHNPEGLNAQVYNRCVGTRYCSNNCPYKVRSFNFFDYSAPEKVTFAFPEPLNWQLNPDVTVRSKGVMEKCTFCVQRILEGKGNARDEHRPLRDLEIQTACQQSCPTQAIVFGDLLDPASRVAGLSKGDSRRYWALNDLNTKPAVTYLKKIDREVVGETPGAHA